MKYIILFQLLTVCCFSNFSAVAQANQDKLDLPGDNLNLYAVLKLFQESETLEGFERSLNDENNKINNLDLNGDNKTDYIQVIDSLDGDIHNIILRVPVTNNELQNVAVIVVEKDKNGQVLMQLIGDEDLYGKDYIIEPDYNNTGETPNPGYTGKNVTTNVPPPENSTTYYQVNSWPLIRFIFLPTYVVWHSPWYWGHYPGYWHPWQPFYWHTYYGYHYHWNYYYSTHYRRWDTYRIPGWHDRYYGGGYRSRSPYVQNKTQQGEYRQTYSRPELATQGSALFRKDNPAAPSVNDKLPSFDKTGRPIVTRPAISNPGTNNPGTGPVTNRPGTRPVITKPGTRPGTAKPVVTQPVTTKPVTKPGTRPVITKPVTSKPATRPAITKPATRPAINKPPAKPQVREAQRRPANPN